MTDKQLFNVLTKELKRLINSNYYFSICKHELTDGSFYGVNIQNSHGVIYHKYFYITDKDLNNKIKDLIYFISQLTQNK